MNISLSSLNRKIVEKSEFKRDEIQQIKTLLSLDNDTVNRIFFDEEVSKTKQKKG